MAVRPIITYENPRLRKKSIKIKRFDHELQTLIDDMIDTMRAAEGIGLAAPQVGILLRVIVCEYTDEDENLQQTVLVNPEITERYGEWMAEEGCLSIPGYVGTVPRAEAVTVKGKSRTGKDVRIKTDGTLAHILQHEIDHLDGVLYIDYLDSMDELRKTEPGRRRRRRRVDGEDGTDDGSQEGADGEADVIDETASSSAETATVGAPTGTSEAPLAPPRGAGSGGGSASISFVERLDERYCCDICGHL